MTSTVKKGKKEPLTDEEKVKQYEGDGMVFKGKVIGIDDVEAARGDKMCQDSMNKLKLAVKASGAHKQRITISVSLQGLKIIDLASGAINHRHPVHKISFIARDVTDNRAFGWVFSPGEGQHKFFAIKTEKQAEAVVLSIRDLFQTVYNVKKAEMDKKKQAQQDGTTDPTNGESYYQSLDSETILLDGLCNEGYKDTSIEEHIYESVQSTKVKSPKKRRKGSPTNESSYDTSTGEPIYQDQLSSNHLNSNTLQLTACLPRVPTNKPVEQDGEAQPAAAEQNAGEAKAGAQVGNLLDLEEELQSLQTGIKDMDKLADLFAAQPNDPFSSPDSTANTPNRQQDLFGSPVAPVRKKRSGLSPWASTPALNTASPNLTPYQKPSFGLFSTTEFIQKDKAAFDRDKFVERWQLSLNNDSLFRKNRSRQQGANSDIARSRPKSRSSLKLQDWQSFEDPTSTVNENRLDASVKVTAMNAPPVKEATAVSSSIVPTSSHSITSAIPTFNHTHVNGSSPVLSTNSNIPQNNLRNDMNKHQTEPVRTLRTKLNPFAQEPEPLKDDSFPISSAPSSEVSRERMLSTCSTIKSPVSPDWVDPFATYQDTPKVATPSSEYDRFLFDKARLELIKSIHQEKPEPPPLSRSRNPFRSSLSTLDDVPRTRKMEVIPEKPVGNPFNPFRDTDSQDSASETVAPQVPARRRRAATGLTRSQSLVTLNEILTPMGSSSLPGSSATTPGDDFLNSLLQPIKANQPLQPIPVNQSQPVLIPTPVNSQSQSKLQPSPSSQLSSVSLPPPPNSKSQPILQSTPVNQSQTSLHSDTSSQSSGPSFPSLDSGSSKTSPERQIGVIRVLDDPFADSPFQQSPSQSESFSSSSQSQQSNPFSDSPFTVDRKEFVNGVSTTPVVNPFGGGDFSKPTTSFSTGGVIMRETKTVFSTPVNKDLVKTDPFGDSFRVTTADSSTLATSAISTSFPESNESRDSERRGNQPPANQAFANPAIQQQIDPFGGSFTAPPVQQPGFSQPPMGFNQPQAGFGQGFSTAPMVTTMQSPPMMAQPGFGSPAGFGASPFNSTTASVGLNTAAIASPPLNTAGQPLVRRPPPEEPKKSDAPDPFADLLDYAADQDKKQMAPPDEGGVEGTSDAFSAYFGSAVGIEADEEAESKPPPSGPPPPLPGADLAGPAPPPRPSANGMAPTPAPRQQNGPASSDPFGFGDSFGAAPPKPTRAAPPTAEADPFGLGSLNPTPATNPAPSNDPFGNEPFAPFDFGGGDSKNTAKQAPPKPDPFGLDPFTQQVG
ncbi:uncharacterized protein LOC144903425 isoform X3 [Branchiostoma floridae x Branchiostoma belcheri]